MTKEKKGIPSRTIVIKLGSSSIVHETTHQTLLSTLSAIVETVVHLKRDGHKVALVSSGAIAVGLKRMEMMAKPDSLSGKQALAAIGQGRLIALWDNLFGQLEQPIAQILLTRGDIADRVRYVNAVNTLKELLSMGVIPIVNENDTISVSEIKFGDNDTLSAITASMIHADYLFLLTDVDGLYTSNPRKDPQAKQIEVVDSVAEIRKQVSTTTFGSSLGTGGMETKLIAADIATAAGVTTVISSSKHPENIFKIIDYDLRARRPPPSSLSSSTSSNSSSSSSKPPAIPRPPHTLFTAARVPMRDLKSWTAHTLNPSGSVIIDSGAYHVLSKRESGGRLLAAGVVGAGVGTFKAFSVRGAVRFEEEEEAAAPVVVAVQEKEKERKEETGSEEMSVTPKAAPAPVVVPAPPVPSVAAPAVVQSPAIPVGTFTLEDVDRRLEQARANSRRMTVTASSASTSTTTTSISASSFSSDVGSSSSSATSASAETRSLSEVLDIFEHGPRPLAASLALLTDEEVVMLVQKGRIQPYALEKALGMDLPNLERAVKVRRAVISRASRTKTLEHSDIPLTQYDYSRVYGACCENVVGYIPLPLGIAGPLTIDGQSYLIPMATAEGTLVASTSRGCKALNAGGGVSTVLLRDAMTRGPAVEFDTIKEAARCARWIESVEGSDILRRAFESTSRFAKLVGGSASGVDTSGSNNGGGLKTALAGRTLYIRFRTTTGDAMGMNMISKGTEKALAALQEEFPTARVLALSGNYCTDKKAAAINWIEGRGKSVVAECVVPGAVVEKVLKTTVRGIVELNIKKNLIGSAMAGVVGGYNAHAANIVAAVFLATGQDPAQVVESSMCLTGMEAVNNDRDLLITVTMPSIEVGTVGGGTVLAPQGGVLSLLGIKGAHPTHPGQNAQQLARIVASAVMAGELSLMSALAAGDLIRAHMTHNRSVVSTPAAGVAPVGEGHGVLVDPAAPVKVLPMTPSSSTTPLPAA